MSWSEGSRSLRRRTGVALALLLMGAAGCTVQPLYKGGVGGGVGSGAEAGFEPGAPAFSALAAARGRIGVAPAEDRTAQIVRNALIFELNGGRNPVSPFLYEVSPTVSGGETVVSIQSGSGVPAASLYRVTVAYEILRISDRKVIAKGTRFASTPFDRSEQLYAATRALLDARETAGKEVAKRVTMAVATAISKDLR